MGQLKDAGKRRLTYRLQAGNSLDLSHSLGRTKTFSMLDRKVSARKVNKAGTEAASRSTIWSRSHRISACLTSINTYFTFNEHNSAAFAIFNFTAYKLCITI